MSHYKLTYFNARGLGEHIRFLFLAAGVPFEDVRMEFSKWAESKPKFKYGQLPILEVDGKELSQSLAIARFLSRQFNLVIEDPFLAAKADELVDFATELRLAFRPYFNEKDEAEKSHLKETLLKETIPKYYKIFEELAGTQSGNFITGDNYSWQDLFIANWIEVWGDLVVGDDFVNQFPKMKKIKESVFAIPAINKYLSTRVKSSF